MKLRATLFLGIIAVLVSGCALTPAEKTSTLHVAASFYPLGEFARQVGGDLITVDVITPAGAEPHDFEPTPQDIAHIYASKLLIANGAGLDPWAERIKPELQKAGVQLLTVTDGFSLHPAVGEEGGPADPHVWLSPVMAQAIVSKISAALSQADPSHADTYAANAKAYNAQLSAIDASFRSGLKQCVRHDIVTSHAAFGYLAEHYGLNQVALAGLSPDEEPSPSTLASVADFARAHGIKYIFFESLVSPKLSQTIATEIGAQTIAFNPIEGLTDAQLKAGANYVTLMQDNLIALRTALGCQ